MQNNWGGSWRFAIALGIMLLGLGGSLAREVEVDGQKFPGIQEALDAHPGRRIFLPGGEYVITKEILIKHDGSGLYGGARIIQSNPEEHIIRVDGAKDVHLGDLTLTRAGGAQDVERRVAVWAEKCERLVLSGVQVLENRSAAASIMLNNCRQSRVADCLVKNYKRITIDDRTGNEHYGFAFKAIDGTGITLNACAGSKVVGNRIIESTYIPSREIRDKHDLGTLTVVPEKRGRLMDEDIWNSRYTNNWHQGAGILIASGDVSNFITISDNYIENAAQGMDIHGDHVTVTRNHVNRAMIGMKTMHGAKHVLISSNHFTYCDLWGVKLMPGSTSRAASAAAGENPAREEDTDGGTILANNIFSHFGMGDQYWNWEGRTSEYPERNVIAILFAPLEENPAITDILVKGNIVHDSGKDKVLVEGVPQVVTPKYFHAMYIETEREPAPRRVRVEGNLFDAGINGVSNVPLIP